MIRGAGSGIGGESPGRTLDSLALRLWHSSAATSTVRFLVELDPRARVPELVITPTVDDFC